MTKRIQPPPEEPISPGHAAYFSPYSILDPGLVRVTGMVRIMEVMCDDDDGVRILSIRNVDNLFECCAFAEELQEPW